MTDNTITQYAVLFTGQKLKKAKTWQDGILKCYSFNAKGRPIVKGDEFEFDRNLVTIESILGTVSDPTQYTKDVNRGNVLPESGNSSHSANDPTKNRLRWRPVFSEFKSPARNHTSHNGMGTKRAGTEEEDEEMPPYYVPPPPNPASLVDVGDEMPPYAIMETRKVGDQGGVLAKNEVTFPKRRKIGLTRPNSSEAAQSNGDGGEECGLDEDTLDYGVEMNKNEAQLRARPHPLVPTSTSATTSLTKLQASTANTERPATVAQPKPRRYMDRFQKLRLRTGIHLSGKERLLWSLKWRKIGDSRTAKEIMTEGCPVYAIRGVSASAEFMMLDNLTDTLHQTPLLPSIINYTPADRPVSTKQGRFKPPSRLPQKSGCLIVKEEYGLDVGAMIKDVIREFTLNEDQESALRALARSVIVAPGWSDGTSQTTPILLVHGVFGAGKSYLIAVMIIFLQRVAAAVASEKDGGEEVEDSLKKIAKPILPFTAQVKPGAPQDGIIIICDPANNGSCEVTCSNIPRLLRSPVFFSYISELKELEYMLENDSLPEKEAKYVQDAIRRFKQSENRGLVARSLVVGTTCMASIFDVFNDIHFPLVILDESSQIAEPMAMVPVARISGERLLLVGDPLQLPPTLATSGSAASAGKGLDKTLFDRAIQCHPRISSISNILFYERRLINGVTMKDRAPLVADLPALCFVDVQGQEQQNPRSKSFNNEAEIKVAVATIRRLLELGVRAADVGVIALYKDQADKIDAALKSLSVGKKRKDGVQLHCRRISGSRKGCHRVIMRSDSANQFHRQSATGERGTDEGKETSYIAWRTQNVGVEQHVEQDYLTMQRHMVGISTDMGQC
ncbi:LOW QUALITY PROTEIN: P-loop containing nucleoside triphosphate hydrolase protein [Jimgerdemannia flammicorona]|uniref:P-loop containing nucleoside triphosphate hydrolase protein n=1 Tax=Jimgerdemannia flammicorona TaxID=994334 RepID=A0A433DGB1_9FUNG|nr:LOW QUALITY PROTEIN: P-loop containing nucleoside triphosphate hydrolase protein [Jimgerdemannia flammicorona]